MKSERHTLTLTSLEVSLTREGGGLMMRILMKNLNHSQPHVLRWTIHSRDYHSSRRRPGCQDQPPNALLPDSKSTTPNLGHIGVRDVALALIARINTPGKTRNLLTGEWFELKNAVEYIGSLYPGLKIPALVSSGRTDSVVDYEPALGRLGLTRMPWRDSIREAAEAVLEIEKDWIAQGIDLGAEGGLRDKSIICDVCEVLGWLVTRWKQRTPKR